MALHTGGPTMKAKAVEGLTGADEQLREIVSNGGWIFYGPLGLADDADEEAAQAYYQAWAKRVEELNAANKPYVQSANTAEGMEWHAPEFGADIDYFTALAQVQMASPLGRDGHSQASEPLPS
ncbi:hypothetical protein ABT154_33760 [Streptomyces sp. NPDC001728]|uniref:hypothetical protein n=1 Tax=Streptomyces sp. NPDC001728 TaxID=3154396 RepID=UPI0033346508